MFRIGWAEGLVIFFTLYIATLVGVVIKSKSVDHGLVMDDYYQHDIQYQNRYYDATKNRTRLSTDLSVGINTETGKLDLLFGEGEGSISGSVLFYRPSDKTKDFTVDFSTDTLNRQWSYKLDGMIEGKWIVKVRWFQGLEEYYKEEMILI